MAVDTLGRLLDVIVTPANEKERARVEELAARIWEGTGESAGIAFVDWVTTRDQPARRLSSTEFGWVVERSAGSMTRFRRWVRDCASSGTVRVLARCSDCSWPSVPPR